LGRWDDDRFSRFDGRDKRDGAARRIPVKWTRIRVAKLAIKVGLLIVAVVFLSIFIPRYGLNTESFKEVKG
jgi:hypothetical protein